MDHPGWRLQPKKEFLGGVPADLQEKGKIRSFGDFGMWDLPELVVEGDRLYSRACDDLVGCSAIVSILDSLEESRSLASALGIFTRAERPPARMGAGPIIRVGDRTSIFDSDVSAFMVETAKSRQLRYQRCLMDGGTCEATAFQLYGYRSAALSIALGNYHNCTPDSRIDAEYVDIRDLEGLINLCVAIATEKRSAADTRDTLRQRLEARLNDFPLK